MRLWLWVKKHPVVANPLIVGLYGALAYLLTNETQLGEVSTWSRAGFIAILSVASAVKNAIEQYQLKNAL